MDNLFGERLRQLRKEAGFKQDELAAGLNFSRATISYYETGTRIPDIQKISIIADFFNVSVDYILGRTNIKKFVDTNNEVLDFLEMFKSLNKTKQNELLLNIKTLRQREQQKEELRVADIISDEYGNRNK